jgi:hypothetical protein
MIRRRRGPGAQAPKLKLAEARAAEAAILVAAESQMGAEPTQPELSHRRQLLSRTQYGPRAAAREAARAGRRPPPQSVRPLSAAWRRRGRLPGFKL